MSEKKAEGEFLEPTKSFKNGSFEDGVDAATAQAIALYHDVDQTEVDPEAERALRWKIDLRLMPLLCFTYALQSIDKNTVSYAAVFGVREEIGLKGTEFSWIGAVFYLGYMLWEFPTSMMLQRFPINYFMSATVSEKDLFR